MTKNGKRICRMIGLGPSAVDCPQTKNEDTEIFGIQYTWENWALDRAFVMDSMEWIIAKNHSFSNPKDIVGDMCKAGIPIYVSKKWENLSGDRSQADLGLNSQKNTLIGTSKPL